MSHNTSSGPPYKVGGTLRDSGAVVATIIGQSARNGVFITEAGGVAWEWYAGDLPDSLRPAVGAFQSLYDAVRTSIPPKGRTEALGTLAMALYAALNSSDEPSEVFGPAKRLIEDKAWAHFALRYFAGAFVTAILVIATLSLAASFTSAAIDEFVLAGIAGIVGALLSVLWRIRKLTPFAPVPLWYSAVQGGTRILLGGLLGAVTLLAIHADLLAGAAAESTHASLLLSLAGGFSEQFVPELLEKVAQSGHELDSGELVKDLSQSEEGGQTP